MNKYSTKQRKLLLDYFNKHIDEQISAKEIAESLKGEGISLSAVYRNIAELEFEGQLKRSSKSGLRTVYYQYTASEHCHNLLHLSCKKCGKTFHMETDGAERLVDDVKRSNGFRLDKTSTVLYGVCANCDK